MPRDCWVIAPLTRLRVIGHRATDASLCPLRLASCQADTLRRARLPYCGALMRAHESWARCRRARSGQPGTTSACTSLCSGAFAEITGFPAYGWVKRELWYICWHALAMP